MEFEYIRDYDPQIVSNKFAVGERIEWGIDDYPGTDWCDTIIKIECFTGIIRKITTWSVDIAVDHPHEKAGNIHLYKKDLLQTVWDCELRKAIEDSAQQKKLDNTPYDAYRLRDPRDKAVFYVGISKNVQRRYKQHLACSGLNFKLNLRIQEILQCGLMPELELIEQSICGPTNARGRERFWIDHHIKLGDQLTNIAEMDEVG